MSKPKQDALPYFIIAAVCGGLALLFIIAPAVPPKPTPEPPAFIEIRPTPAVIPQPAPEVKPAPVKPRDIAAEPTAKLLAEWDQWRRGPAPRTKEIQIIYETLLSRGVIRRDGEPVSEGYGGRRKIGRRR